MVYSNELNSICKKRMVCILEAFISFCEIHQLRYYSCAGTTLGSVRHHGFIPWDDDLDVMMPRPDYDRFINLYLEEPMADFELVYPRDDNSYYLPFAKLLDKNSTLIERRKTRFSIGLFIDIFPIDGFPSGKEEIETMSRDYLKLRYLLSESSNYDDILDYIYYLLTFQIDRAFFSIKCRLNRKKYRKLVIDRLHDLTTKYSYDKACNVGAEDYESFVIDGPFPKAWLEPYIILPFENVDLRQPNKYDDYLKKLYGNYMEYPPIEMRVNSHMENLFYFDLNKRVEYKDVRCQILKKYIKTLLGKFIV